MTVEFGWFIPTMGDTTAFGDPSAFREPNLDMFVKVAQTAEDAGFEYLLVPVQTQCWEAYVTCAMVVARTKKIDALLAARAGFIAPTVMAKMISTFDQLSEGRVRINLITGGSAKEMEADGMFADHDQRYVLLDEAVSLMKQAWEAEEPFDFEGEVYKAKGVDVRPKPFQRPRPPFYLGGMSDAAKTVCAKHADVHLFWGDTPENVGKQIVEMRERAAAGGRQLRFGMRLHVIVREDEGDAWAAAGSLIQDAGDDLRSEIATMWDQSVANRRMQEFAQADSLLIAPHLWSGIATVRGGAGVAIVGNPEQVAATIREFVDAGCSSFCLSGYPHDEEAERFGRLVMPLLQPVPVA